MHRTGAVRRGIEPAWCETTRPVAESLIKSSHCKKDALARRLQQSTQLPAGQPAMSIENIEKPLADHRVEFVDLPFSDIPRVQHPVLFPNPIIEPPLFEDAQVSAGSPIPSYPGNHPSRVVMTTSSAPALLTPSP